MNQGINRRPFGFLFSVISRVFIMFDVKQVVEMNIPIFQRAKHWLIYGASCHVKLRTIQTYSLANFYGRLCSELCFDATSTLNLNLEFATACWSLLFSGCNMDFDHYLCSKLPKRFLDLSTREFFYSGIKLRTQDEECLPHE